MERDPGQAAEHLIDLITQVPDDLLDAPTPCSDYRLRDLLAHIGGVAVNYIAAARRPAAPGAPLAVPDHNRPQLVGDWRRRLPADVRALATAWRQPAAWTGTAVRADGCEMAGDYAGLIVFDELVVHSWDVARSLGRPYHGDPDAIRAAHRFHLIFSRPGQETWREGLFGPLIEVPDDAPLLEQVLGLAGRDPGWSCVA